MTLSRSFSLYLRDWLTSVGESETEPAPEAINMIDTPVWFVNQILDTPRQTTRHNAAQSAAGKSRRGLSLYINTIHIYISNYLYLTLLSLFVVAASSRSLPDAAVRRMRG